MGEKNILRLNLDESMELFDISDPDLGCVSRGGEYESGFKMVTFYESEESTDILATILLPELCYEWGYYNGNQGITFWGPRTKESIPHNAYSHIYAADLAGASLRNQNFLCDITDENDGLGFPRNVEVSLKNFPVNVFHDGWFNSLLHTDDSYVDTIKKSVKPYTKLPSNVVNSIQ